MSSVQRKILAAVGGDGAAGGDGVLPPSNSKPEIKIFEPLHEHAQHNKEGYWGPVTSSIDWCERNYVLSFYVAEWFNTWSNLTIFLLGIWGFYHAWKANLERRFLVVFLGIIAVGIGSSVFHGTLTYIGQQGDETPMIWTILAYWYCLLCMRPEKEAEEPHRGPLIATCFFLFASVWTVVHYFYAFVHVFQLLFSAITLNVIRLLLLEVRQCRNEAARWVGVSYVTTVALGFVFWILDQVLCSELHALPLGFPNPQFHAWWHWLVGLACYFGPTFLIFQRQDALSQEPAIHWTLQYLPLVKSPKRKQKPVAST